MVMGDISSSPLEVGYPAPVTTGLFDTERITSRVADLRSTKLNGTWTPPATAYQEEVKPCLKVY